MGKRSRLAALILVSFPGSHSPAEDWNAQGGQVLSLVRDRFFDRAQAQQWARQNANYAERIEDRRDFRESTRRVLKQLGASHTAFFTSDDPEYHGLRSIFRVPLKLETVEVESIGLDLTSDSFVRVVFAGSPAEQAGIRRGDRIFEAEGKAFRPIAALRGRAGLATTLLVQSHRDGPTREVVVVPRKVDPKVEWLEAQNLGARVVTVGTKKVAYMPFFSAAGAEHEDALRDAIAGPFAMADALVIDFRNGWGGTSPGLINLFNHAPPVLEMIDRDGSRKSYDPQWRKPLYLLINGGSTSGKEVIARQIKIRRMGTVVGEKSAGAVLGGRPFLLDDSSLVYLAVLDVLVDGERIEGNGVVPDVEVIDHLPFAAGTDPQLARALELAGS